VKRSAVWLVLFLCLACIAPAQEHEGGEKDMTAWKWANFAILVLALGFMAAKQGGPYFRSRSIEIRKGIEDATRMRADADERAAAMETRLANIGKEVEALRKSAREEAAQEGNRIRQETQRELAKIQTNADHEIASALKSAQLELKSYSAQLAVSLARTKVLQRMTPADQDNLVRRFVDDLGSTTT